MRVLISAYACEPDRGSEPGVGWLWSLAAARDHETVVLTRRSRAHTIDGRQLPPTLTFHFVDLPGWLLRGVRSHDRLYYVLWQVAAGFTARRLHRQKPFDVAHHITFANAWAPALVAFAGPPFVLGPVGGGQSIPTAFLSGVGSRARLHERLRTFARRTNAWNPLIFGAWRRARVILVQNHETKRRLPPRLDDRMTVRQNFIIDDELARVAEAADHTRGSGRPRAVFAGRLAAIKAPSIALRAIAQSDEWRLDVVGSGPEEASLRELAQKLGIVDRVEFVPWLPRQDLWRRMARADALLVPSLRDEGPMIVAEAYALGLPVIAFDQGGAAVLARETDAAVSLVPLVSIAEGAAAFAAFLSSLPDRREPGKDFTVARIADYLTALYRRCSDEALTT